jgi:hypothetical protein
MTAPKRSLYRLIYRSRQTPAVAADLDFSVQQIIQSAIRSNRAVGLTGLLATVQGYFVQALEGDVEAVRATYARISLDRRHGDLQIIGEGPAAARLFSEWNMCARALAQSDEAILDVIDAKGMFSPTRLTAANAERLLVAMAGIQRRTALEYLVT